MSNRQTATQVAWSFIGTPYIWGGDDPITGFDCSGFVIEILKSVGILPRKGDWTAQGLWEKFSDKRVTNPHAGCLVFWKKQNSDKIVHIEYCLDDELAIGASGGRSTTRTPEDARDQNAYIMVRPMRTRRNIAGYIDPFV